MIPSVVVDTDVVSYIFKQDTRAAIYEPHLAGKVMIISFMTLAELDHWTLKNNWGDARRGRLARYLERFAVFHSDEDLCIKWAQVRDQGIRDGRPIGTADAWIAATALLHGIPGGHAQWSALFWGCRTSSYLSNGVISCRAPALQVKTKLSANGSLL